MPENMEYITLDDETIRRKTKSDPKGFLEEFPGRLFIDFCQQVLIYSYSKTND